VAQRLDLRLPGTPEPVTAVLVDTSQYWLRPRLLPLPPWRNAGITGGLLGDQLDVVQQWLAEAPPGAVKIVMGHHPYNSLSRRARAAIDGWRSTSGLDLYVSAHTHTAHYIVHRQKDETWLELNIGSTTDWPPEFRTLAAALDERYEDRVAFRFQRYPLHRLWESMQIPNCDAAWEVPPERGDFYVAYDQLVTPDPAETQRALLDTLLITHKWRLGFVPSAPGNSVWPSGTASDAEVIAAIDARVASPDIDAKLILLRELAAFEADRIVDDPLIRDEFHLCQAKWASRYDLEGRRVPDVDDAYIVIPKE
jgi:hypothetical protein